MPRIGVSGLPKPLQEPVIWVHALSVGEVISSVSFVKALRNEVQNLGIFFSTSTHTGQTIAKERLSKEVDAFFYFPYDFPASVSRVVQKIGPAAVVMVETDLWPAFLGEIQKRGIRAMLINARLSRNSFHGYKKISPLIRDALSGFSWICTQTETDKDRFLQLGVQKERLICTGNMKFDQFPELPSAETAGEMREKLGVGKRDRILVCGSTHPKEERALAGVYLQLKKKHPDFKMVLVPRDPGRAKEVKSELMEMGLNVYLYSGYTNAGDFPDMLVVDKMGILQALYGIGDLAFVGGSLADFGGHNPLEPAAWGKPVVFGRYMDDFLEVADQLTAQGGGFYAFGAQKLHDRIDSLLLEEDLRKRTGEAARQFVKRNQGAVKRNLDLAMETLVHKQVIQGRKSCRKHAGQIPVQTP